MTNTTRVSGGKTWKLLGALSATALAVAVLAFLAVDARRRTRAARRLAPHEGA